MFRPASLFLALLFVTAGCRDKSTSVASSRAGDAGSVADASAALPADYDPIALVDKGMDAVKVYLAEPRRESWAHAVESVIGGQMRRDLKVIVPEARSLSLGCRSLGCLILIDAPTEKLAASAAVASLVTLGPITASLGLSPDGRAQILFLTDRRMADPAAFVAWYRRIRKQTYDAIRAGKQPNPFPIPAAALPSD